MGKGVVVHSLSEGLWVPLQALGCRKNKPSTSLLWSSRYKCFLLMSVLRVGHRGECRGAPLPILVVRGARAHQAAVGSSVLHSQRGRGAEAPSGSGLLLLPAEFCPLSTTSSTCQLLSPFQASSECTFPTPS